MNSETQHPLSALSIAKRQLVILLCFTALFGSIVLVLYFQDRRQEWRLHQEEATHRLNLAYEVISKELNRVRSDALFLAELSQLRQYATGDQTNRQLLESAFSSFVNRKRSYDQIRLLELSGMELARVDFSKNEVRIVPPDQMQDKSNRYYFQESLNLTCGEIFVSEFDLNQERGEIEQPINPVIRFVTPVCDDNSTSRGLLVLNYLGARLLNELAAISIPGDTLLLRNDGNYLLSPDVNDRWGWLLGHHRTFSDNHSDAWPHVLLADGTCLLTDDGVFASRQLTLGTHYGRAKPQETETERYDLLIASHLPRLQVYATSNQLLKRLLFFGGILFIPLFFLTRYWAITSVRRQQQNQRIQDSEVRLRELSTRLLKIQEDERRAISREIHDELGQQATAINLDLKLAARAWNSNEPQDHLQRAIKENEQLLHSLHDFAKRVRPSTLDDLGLIDAVEGYVSEFQNRTGIEVQMNASLDGARIPPAVSENAFRLVQELLTNVVKHADAKQVEIKLNVNDEGSNPFFELLVADDGVGQVESEVNESRLGILGMRERVDLLRGKLEIDSTAHQGTAVKVRIPLAEETSTNDNG